MTGSEKDGKETYSSGSTIPKTLAKAAPAGPVPPPEEDEDDVSIPVEPGTKCKRKGCNYAFVSDVVSRSEGQDESVCRYHPLPVRNQHTIPEYAVSTSD